MRIERKEVMLPAKPNNLEGGAQAPGSWGAGGTRPNCQCVFQSEPEGAPVSAAVIAWKDRPSGEQPTPVPRLTLGMSQVNTRQFSSQAGPPWPRRVCFGLRNKGGFGSELGICAGGLPNATCCSSAVLLSGHTHPSFLLPWCVLPAWRSM